MTIEEAEHRREDPERGQLERPQADDGTPEYGWFREGFDEEGILKECGRRPSES